MIVDYLLRNPKRTIVVGCLFIISSLFVKGYSDALVRVILAIVLMSAGFFCLALSAGRLVENNEEESGGLL